MRRAIIASTVGIALAGAIGIGVASAATGSGPSTWVSDALAGLVRDGTINEDQAQAVGKALTESREAARAERLKEREADRAKLDALLKETLGMSSQEVRDQLRDGKPLKEIAGDKADELSAGAVALVQERVDAAVQDGRLTRKQADAMVARAKETAQGWLDGDGSTHRWPGLGLLFGGHGMRGPGEHGMGRGADTDGEVPAPAPSASAATSTTSA